MKLKVGDRAEVTIIGNVRAVDGKYVELDNDVYLYADTPGLKMRRVAKPKPPVGTVLTGEQIKNDWWWKRGTIFRLVESGFGARLDNPLAGLVLREDGLLHPLDNQHKLYGNQVYKFSELNPDAKFELRFVA